MKKKPISKQNKAELIETIKTTKDVALIEVSELKTEVVNLKNSYTKLLDKLTSYKNIVNSMKEQIANAAEDMSIKENRIINLEADMLECNKYDNLTFWQRVWFVFSK